MHNRAMIWSGSDNVRMKAMEHEGVRSPSDDTFFMLGTGDEYVDDWIYDSIRFCHLIYEDEPLLIGHAARISYIGYCHDHHEMLANNIEFLPDRYPEYNAACDEPNDHCIDDMIRFAKDYPDIVRYIAPLIHRCCDVIGNNGHVRRMRSLIVYLYSRLLLPIFHDVYAGQSHEVVLAIFMGCDEEVMDGIHLTNDICNAFMTYLIDKLEYGWQSSFLVDTGFTVAGEELTMRYTTLVLSAIQEGVSIDEAFTTICDIITASYGSYGLPYMSFHVFKALWKTFSMVSIDDTEYPMSKYTLLYDDMCEHSHPDMAMVYALLKYQYHDTSDEIGHDEFSDTVNAYLHDMQHGVYYQPDDHNRIMMNDSHVGDVSNAYRMALSSENTIIMSALPLFRRIVDDMRTIRNNDDAHTMIPQESIRKMILDIASGMPYEYAWESMRIRSL